MYFTRPSFSADVLSRSSLNNKETLQFTLVELLQEEGHLLVPVALGELKVFLDRPHFLATFAGPLIVVPLRIGYREPSEIQRFTGKFLNLDNVVI